MENKTRKETMQEIEEMFYGIPELHNLKQNAIKRGTDKIKAVPFLIVYNKSM